MTCIKVSRKINGNVYQAVVDYDETMFSYAQAKAHGNAELDHLERQYHVLDSVIKNYVGGFYSQQRHK